MLHEAGEPHKYRPLSGALNAATNAFGSMEEIIMRGALFIAAAVVTTACGAGSDSDAGGQGFGSVVGDSALLAQWKVELIEADREFTQLMQTAGPGAWLQAFGSDGMMISEGAVHAGQEGIRRAVLPLFADPVFEIHRVPGFAAVSSTGDLGYTIGTYDMTTSGDDGPVTRNGTYLTVWRRQPNGSWKVEADIGNPGGQ